MGNKMIYFKVPKEIWSEFEGKIAKLNEQGFAKNKKHKKLNRSSTVVKLLVKTFEGKTAINYEEPYDFSKNSEMHAFGITVPLEFWKRSRDFVTDLEASGTSVKGGLGGIISGLVQMYNKGKIAI